MSLTPAADVATSISWRYEVFGAAISSSRPSRSLIDTRLRVANAWSGGTTSNRSSSNKVVATRSGAGTGRLTIAMSRAPLASCGSRLVDVASTTNMRTSGCRSPMTSSSRGASHRAVVPIMPMRTVPVTSPRMAATSATIASSSDRTRRARSTTASPSSVSRPAPGRRASRRAPARGGRHGSRCSTARCAARRRRPRSCRGRPRRPGRELAQVHR